jgi:hypothetical protein
MLLSAGKHTQRRCCQWQIHMQHSAAQCWVSISQECLRPQRHSRGCMHLPPIIRQQRLQSYLEFQMAGVNQQKPDLSERGDIVVHISANQCLRCILSVNKGRMTRTLYPIRATHSQPNTQHPFA